MLKFKDYNLIQNKLFSYLTFNNISKALNFYVQELKHLILYNYHFYYNMISI